MRLTNLESKLMKALWKRLYCKTRKAADEHDNETVENIKLHKLEALNGWEWESAMYEAGYGAQRRDEVLRLTPRGLALVNKLIEYDKENN